MGVMDWKKSRRIECKVLNSWRISAFGNKYRCHPSGAEKEDMRDEYESVERGQG
jgi:hypothetical protein